MLKKIFISIIFLLLICNISIADGDWWDNSWSHRKEIILTGHENINKSFENSTEDGDVYGSTKRISSYYIWSGKDGGAIHRGYSEWDISAIPSNAIIKKVTFKYHGYSNAEDCIIKSINIQPSISSASNLYTAIGNGNIYADVGGFPEIGSNKKVILNDNATSDMQSAISTDWFAIGFINKDENNYISEIYSEEYTNANPHPTLYIEYTSISEGGIPDYQMLLNVSHETGMQVDFDDLRFCNDTDEIDSWLESKVDGSYALIWVEFPTTPLNEVEQTYYMYYGNAGVVSNWDIDSTFLFGDDFPGSSLDITKWDKTHPGVIATVSGGLLSLNWGGGGYQGIKSKSAYSFPVVCTLKGYVINHVNHMISGFTDARYSTPLAVFNGEFYDDLDSTEYKSTVHYTTSITYIWDLFRTTTDSEVFQDGVSKWVQSPGNTDNEHKVGCLGYDNSARLYYILVRKYAANPPTYAFGSEENVDEEEEKNEIELIMSEITLGLLNINMGNYLVYAVVLICILLIILVIQIAMNNMHRR